jgi:predicted transposase/invertase (TIGR01784 family)
VFYLDQDAESLEEIQKRLQALFESAKNLSEEEAVLFQDWLWHIFSKRFPKEQQEEVKKFIKQSKRTEVDKMISGLGRNIDKFVKQSREAGLEEGIEKVAKSMLKDGMSIQLIAKYTRLSEEKIRQIQKED